MFFFFVCVLMLVKKSVFICFVLFFHFSFRHHCYYCGCLHKAKEREYKDFSIREKQGQNSATCSTTSRAISDAASSLLRWLLRRSIYLWRSWAKSNVCHVNYHIHVSFFPFYYYIFFFFFISVLFFWSNKNICAFHLSRPTPISCIPSFFFFRACYCFSVSQNTLVKCFFFLWSRCKTVFRPALLLSIAALFSLSVCVCVHVLAQRSIYLEEASPFTEALLWLQYPAIWDYRQASKQQKKVLSILGTKKLSWSKAASCALFLSFSVFNSLRSWNTASDSLLRLFFFFCYHLTLLCALSGRPCLVLSTACVLAFKAS